MSFKKCMIFLTAAALLLGLLPGVSEENALYVRRVVKFLSQAQHQAGGK